MNIQLSNITRRVDLNSSLDRVKGSTDFRDSNTPKEAIKKRLSRIFSVNQPPKEPKGKTFRRPSAPWVHVKITKERVYDIDDDSFERLLRLYNAREISKKGPLECVGYASTSMRLCTVCRDSGKSSIRKDRYYVYKKEKAHSRTVECQGCLGFRLKCLDLRDQGSSR